MKPHPRTAGQKSDSSFGSNRRAVLKNFKDMFRSVGRSSSLVRLSTIRSTEAQPLPVFADNDPLRLDCETSTNSQVLESPPGSAQSVAHTMQWSFENELENSDNRDATTNSER
jgi:hypothetical protein